MNLKYAVLGLGTVLSSCEHSAQGPIKAEAEQVKVEEPFFQGKVINEVKLYNTQVLPDYPYAFTLKDEKDKFFTVNVSRNYAAAVDSRVDEGDIVKIKGQTINTEYLNIFYNYEVSQIQVVEKAK